MLKEDSVYVNVQLPSNYTHHSVSRRIRRAVRGLRSRVPSLGEMSSPFLGPLTYSHSQLIRNYEPYGEIKGFLRWGISSVAKSQPIQESNADIHPRLAWDLNTQSQCSTAAAVMGCGQELNVPIYSSLNNFIVLKSIKK
jgi:hypothetical protein